MIEINNFILPTHTKISTCNLKVPLDYRNLMVKEIEKLSVRNYTSTNVSATRYPGYQIWEDTKVFNKLFNNIQKVAFKVTNLNPKTQKTKIVEAWSIIYEDNDYTKRHNHLLTPYSFVYYVKSDINSSSLLFPECNYEVRPEEDLLVIFPGYLFHEVLENRGTRYVIAGNLIIEQFSFETN